MKSVKIDNIRTAERESIFKYKKQHCVTLGNDQEYYFKNIHSAKAFIAETNRFLNLRLMELNRIHIDTWREYRILYVEQSPVFSNNSDIPGQLKLIERNFDMILRKWMTPNNNHFVFHWFYSIIETLTELNNTIVQELKSHGRHYSINEFIILKQRLELIKILLDTWGHELRLNNPPIIYKLKFQSNEKSE